MKKRLVAILLMVFVLMITGCGNTGNEEEQNGTDSQIADNTDQTNTGENGDISAEEAENILREYLISVNNWESNYVLEPLDPVLGEIENDEIFKFEIRFTDDTDEVGGRLIDNYAVTTDGERIFWYNPADDEWVQQIVNGVVDNTVLGQDTNQPTSVYSYDNDYDRSVVSGDDGKKEWWYVNFANEKNNYVSIMIVDGEVAHVEHFDQK